MNYNFHDKTFKVIMNEGPGAEVTVDTRFFFKQENDVIHADYYGGQVKVGKFIGIVKGDRVHFRYCQVNLENEFNTGHSVDQIERTAGNKLRLIDEWAWETKEGTGKCILEEE